MQIAKTEKCAEKQFMLAALQKKKGRRRSFDAMEDAVFFPNSRRSLDSSAQALELAAPEKQCVSEYVTLDPTKQTTKYMLAMN